MDTGPANADDPERAALERECDVENLRAGGPGGQHRNKRETGIRLVHRPTGTVVLATERRSREQNLSVAYERLARALARQRHVPKPRKRTRPTRASQERRVQQKRHRALLKSNRRESGDE
jgi:protein subunit release factor B